MEKLKTGDPANLEPKKVKSINHALEVLNVAAIDSSAEIKDMINKDYKRIKETLAEVKPEVKGALREMREVSKESIGEAKEKLLKTTKETAGKVDETAHRHPWYFVAGSAVAAGVMGFLLGKKTSK